MRRTKFVEREYYHLYNRGVDKRVVFSSPKEYARFLAYLYLMNDEEKLNHSYILRNFQGLALEIAEEHPRKTGWRPLVAIGAYCLMPNHFHIYATPLAEDGISRFMQRVQTAYTMFFNQRHERTGALFQGTFKAQHVGDDAYAKYLFSYIHLNPAKLKESEWKNLGPRNLKEMREFLRGYPYSSLRAYIERAHVITDPSKFPEYFTEKQAIDDHIDLWLESKKHVGNFGGLASKIAV